MGNGTTSNPARQATALARSGAYPSVDPSNGGLRIGVLIVAYNAVTTLKSVLQRIPSPVWDNIEEIAVFDDASADATYELAVGHKSVSGDLKLHVMKNETNLGYGGNQKAGYRYFIKRGFDIVVLLHGDGQYAPEVLHHLYRPLVEDRADAVFGSRMMADYGGPLKGGMPLYKFVGNKILTTLENRSLGLRLTEFHSGYRAYNLHALAKIDMSEMTDDFHFDTEIIVKLHHQQFRIAEVPIPTFYGSEICYVNGMKYAADVVRAVRRYKSTVRSQRKYPEFAEYFVNYPVKESKDSSHGVVRKIVGRNARILDIGCGDGYFAAELSKECNAVSGIDIIPAPRMRDAFETYVCADLNDGLTKHAGALPLRAFDKILLMDVLQQVVDPAAVLSDARAFLAPHGRVVVSLPNVANLSVRAQVALGKFDYDDRGILDRTHLRFFTRESARALIEACGLKVVSERATAIPVELALDVEPKSPLARTLDVAVGAMTRVVPTLLGYQWVFEAIPNPDR